MTFPLSPVTSPDTVLASIGRLSLGEAAARYAVAGLAVFPCAPGAKRPLTHHGYLDATTDPEQIRAWWRRWPGANIGLPTGRPRGFDVLDIDVHPSGFGFPALARARRAGLAEGWAYLVRTPSGGLHLYFRTSGRTQQSWSLPAVHVDFRGLGGYVIVPPSQVAADGGRQGGYTLIATGRDPHPLDATTVRDLLAPRSASGPSPHMRDHDANSAGRLGAWLADQPEGNRNRALFWAGCRAAEAGIAEADARDMLRSATGRTGLDDREITATLASAYRTAARHPTANGPPPAAMDRPGP